MSERPAWVRPAVIAGAGAIALAVALHFAPSNGDGVVQSVAHAGDSPASAPGGATAGSPAVAAPAAQAGPGAPDLPTRSRIDQSASKDPFAARGWLPPPPPPAPAPVVAVVAEAPPPPTAPPVPFKFVGLIEEKAAKPAAFIAKGDALFVVHVGDVVENTYRVESFNSAQVVVTYLPLQQRQTIEVTGG
jgi:hypothetical protein